MLPKTNRSPVGNLVDFFQIPNLGVYYTNVIVNDLSHDGESKQIQTRISYDHGITFKAIKGPIVGVDGQALPCSVNFSFNRRMVLIAL